MAFKNGDRVTHINHGKGTVLDTETGDSTSIIVNFDKNVESVGDTIAEVSVACLKLTEGEK